MNRNIKYLVVHCTATSQTATVSAIMNYWRSQLGWKNPGYHYLISADGHVHSLQPESKASNGVKGYNAQSIHISYIGGIDAFGNARDTRTAKQKIALVQTLDKLRKKYPDAQILGHRDFPNVTKACPSFDAKTEYKNL